jgi:hypothetical protein
MVLKARLKDIFNRYVLVDLSGPRGPFDRLRELHEKPGAIKGGVVSVASKHNAPDAKP